MNYLTEALLEILSGGKLCFKPITKIAGHQTIKPDERTEVMVYMEKTVQKVFPNRNENFIIRNFTDKDRDQILANDGKCFLHVDANGELITPTNEKGERILLIQVTDTLVV